MEREEKLKQCIEWAVKQGFNIKKDEHIIKYGGISKIEAYIIPAIIFDKSFLKAFFGDECCAYDYSQPRCEPKNGICLVRKKLKGQCYSPSWELNIKPLVMSDDRIEYLYNYIKEKSND